MTIDARFCPRCGAPLQSRPPTVCGTCSYALFTNPRPTAIVIIVREGHFLALRRSIEPGRGEWDLPGGFCDGWEHPGDAAVREAREELGVDVRLGHFVGMYLGSYDFQGERLPVLDCFWLADIIAGEIQLDQAENSEHAWFPLADPPPLAFPTAAAAVAEACRVWHRHDSPVIEAG